MRVRELEHLRRLGLVRGRGVVEADRGAVHEELDAPRSLFCWACALDDDGAYADGLVELRGGGERVGK